jgi:hypothetical protein
MTRSGMTSLDFGEAAQRLESGDYGRLERRPGRQIRCPVINRICVDHGHHWRAVSGGFPRFLI